MNEQNYGLRDNRDGPIITSNRFILKNWHAHVQRYHEYTKRSCDSGRYILTLQTAAELRKFLSSPTLLYFMKKVQ